jgi:hypothetical protein
MIDNFEQLLISDTNKNYNGERGMLKEVPCDRLNAPHILIQQ